MFKLYFLVGALAIGAAGYYYVSSLQTKLDIALVNNAKLSGVVATNQQTITALQQDLVQQAQQVAELNKSLTAAEESKTALLQKLQKHDLTKLAVKKPKLIEDRINAATAKVFSDLEQLTSN